MARSSRRHRIQDGLRGILNNLSWISKHAEQIATLAGKEHPEIIKWSKSFYDLVDVLAETVNDMLEKI